MCSFVTITNIDEIIVDKIEPAVENKNIEKFGRYFREFDDAIQYSREAREAKIRGDYERLYSLCRSYLKNHPNNVIASFDLADCYYKNGNIEKICEIIDRLCEKYPHDKKFLKAHKEIFVMGSYKLQ